MIQVVQLSSFHRRRLKLHKIFNAKDDIYSKKNRKLKKKYRSASIH